MVWKWHLNHCFTDQLFWRTNWPQWRDLNEKMCPKAKMIIIWCFRSSWIVCLCTPVGAPTFRYQFGNTIFFSPSNVRFLPLFSSHFTPVSIITGTLFSINLTRRTNEILKRRCNSKLNQFHPGIFLFIFNFLFNYLSLKKKFLLSSFRSAFFSLFRKHFLDKKQPFVCS